MDEVDTTEVNILNYFDLDRAKFGVLVTTPPSLRLAFKIFIMTIILFALKFNINRLSTYLQTRDLPKTTATFSSNMEYCLYFPF